MVKIFNHYFHLKTIIFKYLPDIIKAIILRLLIIQYRLTQYPLVIRISVNLLFAIYKIQKDN